MILHVFISILKSSNRHYIWCCKAACVELTTINILPEFFFFKMLTKRKLFEDIYDTGIRIGKNPKAFKNQAQKFLLAQYTDASENDVDKFLKSYCSKISKLNKEFKSSKDTMLGSKHHQTFFDTVIDFSSVQVNQSVQGCQDLQDVLRVQDLQGIQNLHEFQSVQVDQAQAPPGPQDKYAQTDFSTMKNQAKKRKRMVTDNSGNLPKQQKMSRRTNERDAKEVRDNSVSSDSLHLASAQEFRKNGFTAAYNVVQMLSEDPERIGKYLLDSLDNIDKPKNPKVPVERLLATLLHRNVNG